jgi:hypothetical protein
MTRRNMTDTLEGIRGAEQRDGHGHARKLARRGQVSYSVVDSQPEPKLRADGRPDNRGAGRRRTRLRSGKILNEANTFVCDCLIHDRSATGLRLALPRNIDLPPRFHVYDDETGEVDVVSTIWRRGAIVGARYMPALGPVSVKPSVRAALRGRFYAMPD